jgi:hypothetical protein
MNNNSEFIYPQPGDEEFLSKIFKKREFYFHRVPKRDKLNNYEDIEKYREQGCPKGEIKPKEQQAILPNFINPNTQYKGVILIHGTGSGKTCTAIGIAEQFKEQAQKYNTKIYVLVPGPNTKENFKKELLTCTGETYLKNKDYLEQYDNLNIDREKKLAFHNALQYYKILSYKTFYKKVLGEKIIEKKTLDNKTISSYKKNDEGEIIREIVVDKITNLNNTLLIIDEAHNMTGNEYGEALKKIIKESENLKIILLTATPMINLPDEIVDLLNYLRPLNDQISKDKIFTNERNYKMSLKPGGLEYLQKMAIGYISYYRGNIPYTFAERIEKGKIPDGLLFTPVINCYMNDFQLKTYTEASNDNEDSLDKGTSAAGNFVFPGLDKNKENIIGYYSNDGMNTIISQLNTDGNKLRSLINKQLFNNKLSKIDEDNFIFESENKSISGNILKLDYLKYFSIKFYKIIKRLNKLTIDKKGCYTAFIYSNLVKAGGIELFSQALLQNGYLEYQEDFNNYDIKDNTLDYKTGLTFNEFKNKKYNLSDFKPATFLLITGGNDEYSDELPEVKQKIIQDVFNNIDNVDGKHIKFILGSKVMNEGITLKNVKEIHILEAFYNIPKSEQVIGRAIRMCVHQDVINENNKFPKVNIYRYVISLKDNKLSNDEILYQKAELKYLTVKKIERVLKEIAIDCALLLHSNMFPEEIEKYKDCVEPTLDNIKNKKLICPALCDFTKCNYKCKSHELDKYWDNNKMTYKKLEKNKISYDTFDDNLARFEINLIKNKIKDLYKFKHVYLYSEIRNLIANSLLEHQVELFDDYFLDKALDELMPKSQNDFNNFKDTIYDKFNLPGYIIQRETYYIFQPFDENEDIEMYYRENINIKSSNQITLNNYIKHYYKDIDNKYIEDNDENNYNFDNVYNYYSNRKENFIVGILDKNMNKYAYDDLDLFKIRLPLKEYNLNNFNRGTVCITYKSKEHIIKLNNNFKLSKEHPLYVDLRNLTREEICNELKNKLLFFEKYSTTKDNNKMNYIIIPSNHPNIPFPYNLEDRIKIIIEKIYKILNNNIDIDVIKSNNGTFLDKTHKLFTKYTLTFKNNKFFDEQINNIIKLGFTFNNNQFTLNIE